MKKLFNIKEKEIDYVLHLSDSDFDGYSSQYFLYKYITKYKPDTKIIFRNSEPNTLNENMNYFFDFILSNKQNKYLFLITDISLTEKLEKKLNNFKRGNSNIEINYQLIDHHISGELVSSRNDWYYMNIEACAGRLTYLWLENNFGKEDLNEYISNLVNAHDIALEESKLYHKGNYIADLIFRDIQYPNLLKDYKREHLFFLIENVSKEFFNGLYTEEVERRISDINLEYLKTKMKDKIILNDKDISVKHKMYKYFAELIKDMEFKVIEANNQKIIVVFDLKESFQYLSKHYLLDNPDIDIMLNVKRNKKISGRTRKDHINLALICETHLNGGGHKKAAGGYLNKEVHSQEEAEEVIEKLLKGEE